MKKYSYPDKIAIKPLDRPVNATIRVPPSKSITNRALVLAALACRKGPCRIKNILISDDTEAMIGALRQLGFAISLTETDDRTDAEVASTNPLAIIPARQADLFVGGSGTTMRFLTAMVALGQGRYRIDGDARMRERPIEDLLDALHNLGVDAKSELDNGCPPVIVNVNGLVGGTAVIRADISSQFVSALMMIGPFAASRVVIRLAEQSVSEPYVRMTQSIMAAAKVLVDCRKNLISIDSNANYELDNFTVEPDATSASYFFGASAITGGRICIDGFSTWPLFQGDLELIHILILMNCQIEEATSNLRLIGKRLVGITAEMGGISDTSMTLAAVACFADSPTTIRNVAHIRHKECDRIAAMTTELRKLGVEVEEHPDGWTITPRPMHGAELETYNDHRIAMSLALIGLKVPGVVIKNPGCVAKTYPGFWEDFELLYQ